MANDWMIYGKEKGKKQFRPFTGEGFTGNIIYALRFPPNEGEKVKEIVEQLNRDNPRYIFEARRGKGSIFPDPDNPKKGRDPWKPENPEDLFEYYESPRPDRDGDLIIRGRAKGSGVFLPFDGYGFTGDPLRWPSGSGFRQNVMSIARSLEVNNPHMEFEVVRLSDTVFRSYPRFAEGDPFKRRYLHNLIVEPPYDDGYGRPDNPKRMKRLDKFPDTPVQPVPDYPMDYSTQMFGMELVTEPIAGRRSPSAKCRAIDTAIAAVTQGQASVLKSTLKGGTYYAVVEACNSGLGSCQRILLTGRVLDCANGAVSTFLLQSDTGSYFLDVPRSYLKMIDDPRTEADERYRQMMNERLAGDGRPWNKRRYTVDGEEMDADQMVSRVSKLTGRTPWQVQTTRGIRAMRVHDSYEAGGSKIVRCFNMKRKR